MYCRTELTEISEYFTEYHYRKNKGVFFCRINKYDKNVEEFIFKFYEEAVKNGVVIENKIQNPDEKNLAYYEEIMGMEFKLNLNFIFHSLEKWLPRINNVQRENLANSLFFALCELKKQNKTDNMIKNAYIKFMCWLYYKFERILNKLGDKNIPKILYEGYATKYELILLSVLCSAGCDIVIIQYSGDAEYLKTDPLSSFSFEIFKEAKEDFPKDFSVKEVRRKLAEKQRILRACGEESENSVKNCTNAWLSGDKDVFKYVKMPSEQRGSDPKLFYNCFIRVWGAENKAEYLNNLFKFYNEISLKRNVVVVQKQLGPPLVDEISRISRSRYQSSEQMILDLSKNIICSYSSDIQKEAKKVFIELFFAESEKYDNINKFMNVCVYFLCWYNRFKDILFKNLKYPNTAVFIMFGEPKSENEALFLKFLYRLPVDVIIFVPDTSSKCVLTDKFLYDIKYEYSLTEEKFPTKEADLRAGTTAYHAERELDEILYDGSGIHRIRQYKKAVSLRLKTTYEEIFILWNQDFQFRPGFDIIDEKVILPVISAKICGVKDKNISEYWQQIKKLITENTYIVKGAPFIQQTDMNPVKKYAVEFFKNGKVLLDKIKNHKVYQYNYLREEVQNYILEKIQVLIDSKIIDGTYEDGSEYLIISTILNINKQIIRLIQNLDFTGKVPKIIFIDTDESVYSKEDVIVAAFLNLVGFDVLFFVPTGYRNIEQHLKDMLTEEFQSGEFIYDLQIPNLGSPKNKHSSFFERILKNF